MGTKRTTMKHPRARPPSEGDALASNCTYTSYVVSRSALYSMTISTANSRIRNNHTDLRRSSIQSIKCQRVRSHHRRKQASHEHSNAASSKAPRETAEINETDGQDLRLTRPMRVPAL